MEKGRERGCGGENPGFGSSFSGSGPPLKKARFSFWVQTMFAAVFLLCDFYFRQMWSKIIRMSLVSWAEMLRVNDWI
ncbi:hypothetical protein LJC19_07190 [Oxalobacter sp. OttesenSCG-928-P03]|nr:hypothetical protein [Oxalobacter sp. OttesenSCG-928-P03]